MERGRIFLQRKVKQIHCRLQYVVLNTNLNLQIKMNEIWIDKIEVKKNIFWIEFIVVADEN